MALEAINDHVSQALARLELQFRDSADVLGITSALALEVQALEDAFQQLNTLFRSVNAATGATLDRIGEIVNAPARGLRDDAETRTMLYAAISRNVSFGRVEDFLTVLNSILGGNYWDRPFAIDANDTFTGPSGAKGGDQVLFVEDVGAPYPPSDPPSQAKVEEALGFLKVIAPAGSRVILATVIDPALGANVFRLDSGGSSLDVGYFYSAFDRV